MNVKMYIMMKTNCCRPVMFAVNVIVCHKNLLVDDSFECLQDIIKTKTRLLYTPLRRYNWNNCEEILRDGINEKIACICIMKQRCDFKTFYDGLGDMQK